MSFTNELPETSVIEKFYESNGWSNRRIESYNKTLAWDEGLDPLASSTRPTYTQIVRLHNSPQKEDDLCAS